MYSWTKKKKKKEKKKRTIGTKAGFYPALNHCAVLFPVLSLASSHGPDDDEVLLNALRCQLNIRDKQ